MKKKLLINTGLSIVLWLIVFSLIESDLFSFREMAHEMKIEDVQE